VSYDQAPPLCAASLQAGKKVALQASAALQQATATLDTRVAPATAQLPLLLAVPSERDCAGAIDGGEEESEPYDRMKPLRVSVVALDLVRGLCLVTHPPARWGCCHARVSCNARLLFAAAVCGVSLKVELPPGRHPLGLTLVPDEFVSADPIPAAVRAACERWASGGWAADPLYHFLAGHPPELAFPSEDATRPVNPPSGGVFGAEGRGVVARAAWHLAAEPAAEPASDDPAPAEDEKRHAARAASVPAADAAAAAFGALRPWSYLAIQGPPGTGKTTVPRKTPSFGDLLVAPPTHPAVYLSFNEFSVWACVARWVRLWWRTRSVAAVASPSLPTPTRSSSTSSPKSRTSSRAAALLAEGGKGPWGW
jgi:hypothetical protein